MLWRDLRVLLRKRRIGTEKLNTRSSMRTWSTGFVSAGDYSQIRMMIEQDPEVAPLQTPETCWNRVDNTGATGLGETIGNPRTASQLESIDKQFGDARARKEQAVREAEIAQAQTMYFNAMLPSTMLEQIDQENQAAGSRRQIASTKTARRSTSCSSNSLAG